MTKKIGISDDRAGAYLRGIFRIFSEFPVRKKAELGDIGALLGAHVYLKQRVS